MFADENLRGFDGFVVVRALGHVVEHGHFLQFLAPLECLVGDEHGKTCFGVAAVAVAVLEDDGLDAALALESVAGERQCLVVVVTADVAVEAQFAAVLTNVRYLDAFGEDVADFRIVAIFQHLHRCEVAEVCRARHEQLLHRVVVRVGVLRLTVGRGVVGVDHALAVEVVVAEVAGVDDVLIGGPAVDGVVAEFVQEVVRDVNPCVGAVGKHALTDGHLAGVDVFHVVVALVGVENHVEIAQVGTVGKA